MPDPSSAGGPPGEAPGDEAQNAAIRLQAFLARAGVASRRAAERIILDGRVSVNGAIVKELGTKVSPGDIVALDGRALAMEDRKRYILLNKPPGYLCAMSDPEGRPLAIDLLRGRVAERVYNVGRLDQWSSGLLLFTNDGELASRLVHPSGGIDKEYEFTADGPIEDSFFSSFKRGITIEGVVYRARSAERRGPCSGRVVLVEGKNREIRRVLEVVNRRAKVLRRIRIGPLSLGDLPEGVFRDLSLEEIESLRTYSEGVGGGYSRPSVRGTDPTRR
jgi:23S rRNA pseudouridine2605 synthase